ncbi:MAG: FG-GAP repeat protein [Candidatus Zixiibacteriota bacterium]
MPDAGTNVSFGLSVAVQGDRLVAGADLLGDDHPDPFEDGALFLYKRIDGVWEEDGYILPSSPSGAVNFARDIALDGPTIVAGDPHYQRLQAYVFRHDGERWVQEALLNTLQDDSAFGAQVAVSGDTVLVASPQYDLDDMANAGAVHVYIRTDGGHWIQQALLTAGSRARQHVQFGQAVAIDGDMAVVGTPWFDNPEIGLPIVGETYVFTRADGVWSLEARLYPGVLNAGSYCGPGLAIDGDRIALGCTGEEALDLGAVGAVHIFERVGREWTETATLTNEPPSIGSVFGYQLALDGDILVVGTLLESWDSGAAVFRRIDGAWTFHRWITKDGGFGQSGPPVAVSGASVVMGDSHADPEVVGAAYVWDLEDLPDEDGDGIEDDLDNCPCVANSDQIDFDRDGAGDLCDDDGDGDGISNATDACIAGPIGAPVNSHGRPIGDMDEDCRLDLVDYSSFAACANGPSDPPPWHGCGVQVFDTDGDIDIDLLDFANFQEFFTGE